VLFCPKDKFGVDGKEQFSAKAEPFLRKLDYFLAGRKFAAGNNITIIDFELFDIEDMARCFDSTTFDSLPNINAHFNHFAEIP
jgi:glutathione S-transferase